MDDICRFVGTTPLFACSNCSLFLETCVYVASSEGFALGAECGDFYICIYCNDTNCKFKDYINI